jgi:peptidoglycan/xylan/chitin deacetylase (PgdA/CDA1 family)
VVVRAALTFDAEHSDRPCDPGSTERLVEVLGSAGIRATFFLQGRWAEAVPSLARSIANAGHVVGNHSHYHARMSHLTDDGIADDLARATTGILETTGIEPRPWFRCPFGDGASDARVLAVLAAAGYRHVGWHVDAEDWAAGAGEGDLERSILDGIRRVGDGAVVLLHAWPTPTPGAVERLLANAAAQGIAFVGIDELPGPPVATVPW